LFDEGLCCGAECLDVLGALVAVVGRGGQVLCGGQVLGGGVECTVVCGDAERNDSATFTAFLSEIDKGRRRL
jgi:hypothetical protein